MINTWNPAEISDKLNQLEGQIKANDVIANPEGEATEALTKVEIDGDIYSVQEVATTAEDVSYDNTESGLTADDVQAAIDEVEGRVDTLESNPVISRSTTTVTTNASGAASISASDAPLTKTITIDIISPTGYYLEIYRGASTYGVEVKDKGTDEPLASSDVELEIWKIN